MKRLMAALLVTVTVSSVMATEFRTPLPTERGPIRYLFDKEPDREGWDFSWWNSVHSREAHKAFQSHGTSSKPLSAIFFNEADFRLNQIFPNSKVPLNTEFYNPFMRVLSISPRIAYQERSVNFGARFELPVWKHKGRLGLRFFWPFRDIEIERKDSGARDSAGLENVAASKLRRIEGVIQNTNQDPGAVVDAVFREEAYTYGWRLDFVEALALNTDFTPMIDWENNGNPGQITVADQAMYESMNLARAEDPRAFVVASPEGIIPFDKFGAIIDATAPAIDPNAQVGPRVNIQVTPLPVNLVVDPASDDKFVGDAVNKLSYAGLSDDINPNENIGTGNNNECDIQLRKCLADRKAGLWITSLHDGEGRELKGSETMRTKIQQAIAQYPENAFEWMHDRGMDFDSTRRVGWGDLDIDLFYEHRFGRDLAAEFMFGVRFPTGHGDDYSKNPFQAHTGNGDHYEIKLGSMCAWSPWDWANIKFDWYYSWVLEATETRAAAFKGACIKNIGPCVKADVDWGYFVGRLDFTLFHPKTKALSSNIGYEFYYKSEDDIDFKDKCTGKCITQLQSWLGREFKQTVTKENGAVNVSAANDLTENLQCLDEELAESNSEQYGHKLRSETSYRFSRWFEGFAGTGYVFAGKNIAREFDLYAGFNVTW